MEDKIASGDIAGLDACVVANRQEYTDLRLVNTDLFACRQDNAPDGKGVSGVKYVIPKNLCQPPKLCFFATLLDLFLPSF